MKLTVKTATLIEKIQAFVTAMQAEHDAKVHAFNDTQTSVKTLVEANKPAVAKFYRVTEAGPSEITETIALVLHNLGLGAAAPAEPSALIAAKRQLTTLSLASDETLELEDNSPYLQYVS